MTNILDRITDSGDDLIACVNGTVRTCGQTGEIIEMTDYYDPMGDYLVPDSDDRQRWEAEMMRKDEEYEAPVYEPVNTRELLMGHLHALKKIHGGK